MAASPIPGSGIGNKGYSREGFFGQFYFGPHFDLKVVTQHGEITHGSDRAMATRIDGTATADYLPQQYAGNSSSRRDREPTWNGYTFEAHYVYSPQLIFRPLRDERMSQQVHSWDPVQPGKHQQLLDRLPLQPVYDQPGRLCLHRRVQLVPPGSDRHPASTYQHQQQRIAFRNGL